MIILLNALFEIFFKLLNNKNYVFNKYWFLNKYYLFAISACISLFNKIVPQYFKKKFNMLKIKSFL